VLRGPQGTLYGGSSEGGTIRVITPKPSLTDYSSYTRAEVNSVQEGDTGYELGLAFGGPLVRDKIGFRVSAWHEHASGWIDDVSEHSDQVLVKNANWTNTDVARLAMLFAASDDLSIASSLLYSRTHQDYSAMNYYVGNVPGATIATTGGPASMPLPNGTLVYPATTQYGKYRLSNNYYTSDGVEAAYKSPSTATLFIPTLTANYELSAATLQSTTSYTSDRTDRVTGSNNGDYANFGIAYPYLPAGRGPNGADGLPGFTDIITAKNNRSIITEELRLSSKNGGRLNWLVGGYYTRGETMQDLTEAVDLDLFYSYFSTLSATATYGVPGNTGTHERIDMTEESVAGFGEATYALTERLKVTAGVRVARETLDYNRSNYSVYGGTTAADPQVEGGSVQETPVLPKVALSYQATSDTMLYATAAKGFRSGGVNNKVPAAFLLPFSPCYADIQSIGGTVPATYNSDSLWSYDAGAKFRLLDNKLHVAAGAYYINWKNIITQFQLPCSYSFISNAPSAVSQGMDLESEMRLSDRLSVSLTAAYTDAHYSKTYGLPGFAAGTADLVRKGDQLPIPEWSGSIGIAYEMPLADRVRLYTRGDYQMAGSWSALPSYGTLSNRTNTTAENSKQSASRVASLRVGMRSHDLDVSLFANNLLNNDTPLLKNRLVNEVFPRYSSYQPRTIGLTVTYRH